MYGKKVIYDEKKEKGITNVIEKKENTVNEEKEKEKENVDNDIKNNSKKGILKGDLAMKNEAKWKRQKLLDNRSKISENKARVNFFFILLYLHTTNFYL